MSLELLKTGFELLSGSKEKGKTDTDSSGMFGKIMEMVGGKKNPEIAQEAKDAKESAEKERAGIFGEIGKSLFLRQFPRMAAVFDIQQQLSSQKKAEVVPWQNEFETITAFLILIPNQWKHVVTDLFADSSVFRTLVEHWPGLDGIQLPAIGEYLSKELPLLGQGGPLRERILNQKDPDAVIQALRIMHQDIFVTGKVSFDWLKEKLGGNAAALGILGGGAAALTAGGKLLEGSGNGSSSGSGLVDKAKEALGIKVTGKKITELVKSHPELEKTTMQQNLIKLLNQLKVLDSAELVRGDWNSNDEVTVAFKYENAKYFLIFDNDTTGTDLILNTSEGRQIAKFTDWGGFDADDSANELIKAIKANPSPSPASP